MPPVALENAFVDRHESIFKPSSVKIRSQIIRGNSIGPIISRNRDVECLRLASFDMDGSERMARQRNLARELTGSLEVASGSDIIPYGLVCFIGPERSGLGPNRHVDRSRCVQGDIQIVYGDVCLCPDIKHCAVLNLNRIGRGRGEKLSCYIGWSEGGVARRLFAGYETHAGRICGMRRGWHGADAGLGTRE